MLKWKEMKMTRFKVGGMSCAACSARVEKAVRAVSGVDSCSVNLLTGTMSVDGDVGRDAVIAAVVAAGYTAEPLDRDKNKIQKDDAPLRDTETPKLIKRLLVSLIFLSLLMYVAMGHMLGAPLPTKLEESPMALGLLQMLLSASVLIINQKYFISGLKAVLKRAPNMDTLVALGSFVSFAWSVFCLFAMALYPTSASKYLHELYFESAAMILVLITVGKTLESKAKGKTTDAIRALMTLSPKIAIVIRDGEEVEIPADDVKIGDIFIVRPGSSIPVDGEVIEGESAVDESALTGESVPSEKSAGALVFAATVNRSGFLKCKATSVGEGTAISGIIKMVSEASATKAPIAKIADKVSGVFVPFVISVSVVTLIIWLALSAELGFALARAISVLVISCPCALGLATPVAIMVGSGVGAKRGILFKNAASLEASGRVTHILLDKTGTVTEGRPRVEKIITLGCNETEILPYIGAVEEKSEHPLGIAVFEYVKEQITELPSSESFEAIVGGGVRARINDSLVEGGSMRYISSVYTLSDDVKSIYEKMAEDGETPLLFVKDGTIVAIVAVKDTIKHDSAEAISEMRRMGLKVTLLTGDNETTARSVAKKAQIDEVISGVLPDGKAQVVDKLSQCGKVMMIGDGINDAPALVRADVGVAIGAGTDVAIDSADVVLMRSTLMDAVRAVKLGRCVLRNIKQNLFWAFCYNIIGIPLAAGAFIAAFGWELNPMFGAAAMSISSFAVVMNALRINFIRLDRTVKKKKSDVCVENNTDNDLNEYTLKVNGMMCSHCEARVKEAVLSLDGALDATADHKRGIVTVFANATLVKKDIVEAIKKAGYKVL